MKIFIDESGSFGWNPKGVSIFCAVTVADRVLPELTRRFAAWKRRFTRSPNLSEIKGKSVAPSSQASFVTSVIHPCQDFWLTIVGADTRLYSHTTVEAFKSRAVDLMEATSRWAQRGGKAYLAMEFTQVTGWLRQRSPENYLAMLSLEEVIRQGIQQSIVRFAEPQDDAEFENIDISIDRSFIKEQAHLQAWKACLRNFLYVKD